jgi:hypothetical protein
LDYTLPLAPLKVKYSEACAFALQFRGRKRIRTAGDIMATIAAERVAAHLEEAGFVIMRKPPTVGAAALGRGYEPPERE